MPDSGRLFDSLRPNRIYGERISIALAISVAVHIVGFGGYELGKAALRISPWLRALVQTKPALKPVQQFEEPVQFVMVNQPAPEAPKNAKYYSAQNSRAANPDADKETGNPKLNGKQTEIAKVDDTARPNPNKLQPAQPQPEQKSMSPGDLILGKSQKQNEKQQEQRPRKLQEALAQRHMAGPQMKQNGGVQDHRLVASFDAKATPFGAYDQRIVEAVTQRWYDLLDSRNFALDRVGKVTVRFHLNYDGSVSEMQIVDSNVGDILSLVCRDAIEQAAPFGAWPGDMRRMVAMNYREITFTFYYY